MFTSIAPCFIAAISFSPIKPLVSGVKGVWIEIISAFAMTSMSGIYSSPRALAAVFSLLLKPISLQPNALKIAAVLMPIAPVPTIPTTLPASSLPARLPLPSPF